MAHSVGMCHLHFMWCPDHLAFDGTNTGAAFVACRWHELFDEFTPDTFHPKLFSLSTLAAEATAIGELHAHHDAWLKHLKHVQMEIGDRLEVGLERTVCTLRHVRILDRMRRTDSVSEVVGAGRLLRLEGFQSHLEGGVVERFRNLDITSAATKKHDADELLATLATHAFRKGCSSRDCKNVAAVLQQGPEAVKSWILTTLPEYETEFDCIIAIDASEQDAKSAISAVCDNANIKHASPNVPGLPSLEKVIFLRRTISALRSVDAVDALKTDVRSRLNLFALYKQRNAPTIRPEAWVFENQQAILVDDPVPQFRNLHPRRDAISLAGKAASALTEKRYESAIRSALDLHNLGLSMTDQRLRLVNLWSALECLASIVEGDSIISRVQRLVCPILTWRKIDKIVRYIAISVHFWLQRNPQIDRETLPFGLKHNKSVPAERILTLLTEPLNSTRIRSLLNAVSGHPLLLYRVNTGWESLHDPKRLKRDLAKSEERLGWHLWRIYRARNLLVHQGIESDYLPQLANHLQQYLSWTLSRILHGLSFGTEWSARDSWYYWMSKNDYLMTTLEAQPDSLTLEDVFPDHQSQPNLPMFPPAAPPDSGAAIGV